MEEMISPRSKTAEEAAFLVLFLLRLGNVWFEVWSLRPSER
jgi:hypothetical protein